MLTKSLRPALLGATAAILAGVVPASAFDEITWTWNLDLSDSVSVDVDIDVTSDSVAIIENEQEFYGTSTALSTVDSPTIDLDVIDGPYDVDDVALVVSEAAALGNNASIESDVATMVDSSQFTAALDTGVTIGGLLDLDTELAVPSVITATSTVDSPLNTQVDSSAQAIANNLSISLDGATNADRHLIANSTQVAYALTTATSTVNGASTDVLFDGIGTLDGPLVKSMATAVGNNLSIDVSAPSP